MRLSLSAAGAAAGAPTAADPLASSSGAADAAAAGGRRLYFLTIHRPGPVDERHLAAQAAAAASGAGAAQAAAAARQASLADEFAGMVLKGGGIGGGRKPAGPGPLPRYGSAAGISYMLCSAAVTDVLAMCKAKIKVDSAGKAAACCLMPAACGCHRGPLLSLFQPSGKGSYLTPACKAAPWQLVIVITAPLLTCFVVVFACAVAAADILLPPGADDERQQRGLAAALRALQRVAEEAAASGGGQPEELDPRSDFKVHDIDAVRDMLERSALLRQRAALRPHGCPQLSAQYNAVR